MGFKARGNGKLKCSDCHHSYHNTGPCKQSGCNCQGFAIGDGEAASYQASPRQPARRGKRKSF